MEWSNLYFKGFPVKISIKQCISVLKIFILAKSVDPDEMPSYVAFNLGLHCFPKYGKCSKISNTKK